MKISIGMNLATGPWGGGNQFGNALVAGLRGRGCEVCFDLTDPDIDVIVLAEPNAKLKVSAYDHKAILKYLLFRNPKAVVVHRVNNTSEARDDLQKTFNKFRIAANQVADHTVFISDWIRTCYIDSGFDASRPNSVILNGGDAALWKPAAAKTTGRRVRIVTHHWSNHENKGFDVYRRLDEMLSETDLGENVEFTYIGRLPEEMTFKTATHKDPMSGEALCAELQGHDVYLTASKFEGAGMHHIEAGLCGLPLLYRNSGALPEYCNGFGVEFTAQTFEDKLHNMIGSYPAWTEKMPAYPHTAERMCEEYYRLFETLLAQRGQTTAQRRFWKRPLWLAQTLLGK